MPFDADSYLGVEGHQKGDQKVTGKKSRKKVTEKKSQIRDLEIFHLGCCQWIWDIIKFPGVCTWSTGVKNSPPGHLKMVV